jgi:hypothetical protein
VGRSARGARKTRSAAALALFAIAWLVGLGTFLLSSDAAAAVGQCQGELASVAPASDLAESQDWDELCQSESSNDQRTLTHRDVPICLWQGASAIAPLPVLPTDGASAEAAPRACPDARAVTELTSGSDHPPKLSPRFPVEGVLASAILIPARGEPALLVAPALPPGAGRLVTSSVYRPPRA